MHGNQQSTDAIAIHENRIFLLYPVHSAVKNPGNALLSNTASEMMRRIGWRAAVDWESRTLPPEACPWRLQDPRLHPDFGKRFHELFCGGSQADISLYRLGPEILEKLNGSDPAHQSLELILSGIARERINQHFGRKIHTSLWLKIQALQMACFRFSAVSVMIAEIEWRLPDQNPALDMAWLVEGLYGLKHGNQMVLSRNTHAGDSVRRLSSEPEAFFSFSDLLGGLIGEAEMALDPNPYSAAFLQTHDNPPEDTLETFGTRLSLNYSLDYEVSSQEPNSMSQQPFKNLRHIHGRNGTVTFMSGLEKNPPKSDYLANFLDKTYRSNYLMMYLCLCHEHKALSEYAEFAGFALLDSRDQEQKLKALQKALLTDRLTYRFSQVSRNPLHDRYWETVQRALGLLELRRYLAEQTREIDAYLQRETSEHGADVMRWPLRISGAGIAALTTFTVIKEFIEAIGPKWIGHAMHEYAGILAVAGGLIAGLLAMYFMRRAEKHSGGEKIKEHALIEIVGGSARKS